MYCLSLPLTVVGYASLLDLICEFRACGGVLSRIFHIGVGFQPTVGILCDVWPAESVDKVLGTGSGSFPDVLCFVVWPFKLSVMLRGFR